jgi:hypothetical protein
VGQGAGNDPLGLAGRERVPAFCFADKLGGADASMDEAAVDGQRQVVVDPAS